MSVAGGAVLDELLQPRSETAGVDQVDEVTVADPLLELDVRHPSGPLALAVRDGPPHVHNGLD